MKKIKSKKKIGIFSSSFNPIHQFHLDICLKAKKEFNLDKVLLVINYKSINKKTLLSYRYRLQLLYKFIRPYSFFDLEFLELKKKKISYSYKTILELKEKYGKANDYFFIVGQDQINDFDSWRKPKLISRLVNLVGVLRPNTIKKDDILKKYKINLLDIKKSNFSSSLIRNDYSSWSAYNQTNDYFLSNNFLFLKQLLKNNLSKKRFLHSLRVAKTTKNYAKKHKMNWKLLYNAALLHDIAKEFDKKQMEKLLLLENEKLLEEPIKVWHSFVGGIFLKNNLLFSNKKLLNSIFYHTTGHPSFTNFEKLIFLCDKMDNTKTKIFKVIKRRLWKNIDNTFWLLYNYRYHKLLKTNNKKVGRLTKTYYNFLKIQNNT